MSRESCPNCGKLLIYPAGNPKSKVLLIGEYPGSDEVIQGFAFVGNTGDILREELLRVGIQMFDWRATNLWVHAKDEKGCDVNWHKQQMVNELKGRSYVLLMGSDLTKLLFNKGVMETSGLEMPCEMFPKIRFFVSPNPAQMLHGPVGEFRLSLSRLLEATNE